MKVNELAPGRFNWRKYPEQVNLELVRIRLSEAKQPSKGSLLTGSNQKGWFLTSAGLEFARTHASALRGADLRRRQMTTKERQWLSKERARMLSSRAFEKYSRAGASSVSVQDAEEFFGLNDYVTGTVRMRKLDRISNLLTDDVDVGGAVQDLLELVQRV